MNIVEEWKIVALWCSLTLVLFLRAIASESFGHSDRELSDILRPDITNHRLPVVDFCLLAGYILQL